MIPGTHHSPEAIRKMSMAKKGKKLPKEHVKNIIKSLIGRKHTEESKIKMSESAKRLYREGRNGSRFIKGEEHMHWKGGKIFRHGYIFVKKWDHPHCDSQGYVREHRLIMEKHIGRYLKRTEIVHHNNNCKTDNRIENLRLFENTAAHTRLHMKK